MDNESETAETGITPDAPEGWRLMKEKATGRVIGMRYIPDACDGGAWEIRGEKSFAHPDTIYHGWEDVTDAE